MHSLITSYLLQSKECVLPGIGTLQIKNTPATVDDHTNQIFPPSEEIVFKEESNLNSTGLVKYIADKKNINLKEAEHLLINFCKEENEKINSGEKLSLETIGTLKKDENDEIYFEKELGFNFFNPVVVDKVYEPQVIKEELVTEDEYDSPAQKIAEENEVIVERSQWGWWAAILTAIAFAAIFFYFKDQKLSGSSAGNHQPINVGSASPTYIIPR